MKREDRIREVLLRVENGGISSKGVSVDDVLFLLKEYIFELKGREVQITYPLPHEYHLLESLLLKSRELFASKIGITKIFRKDGSLISVC